MESSKGFFRGSHVEGGKKYIPMTCGLYMSLVVFQISLYVTGGLLDINYQE